MAAFDWGKFAAAEDYGLAKGSAPIVSAHLANLILKLERHTVASQNGTGYVNKI